MTTKSTPSPASSVPAPAKFKKYRVTLNFQYPAHGDRQGITYEVEARSKSDAIKEGRRQMERDGHAGTGVGKGRQTFKAEEIEMEVPVPAEDVACVPSKRTRIQWGTDEGIKHGGIIGSNKTHFKVIADDGREFSIRKNRVALELPAPSPAEPVKVLGGEHTRLPWVVYVDGDGLACIGDEAGTMSPIADFTRPEDAAFVLEAVRSHAAHLAKIQALTEALSNLLHYYESRGSGQGLPMRLCPEHAAARKALSLPSA